MMTEPTTRKEGIQGPPKPQEAPPVSPLEAVRLALADALRLPEYDRRYIRYLFCPEGDFKAANVAVNVVSRGLTPVRCPPVEKGLLLRVDCRLLARFDVSGRAGAGKNQDIEDWLHTWEQLRYDPTFSLLITRDNVKFAQGHVGGKRIPAATKTVISVPTPTPVAEEEGPVNYQDGAYHYHPRGVWQETPGIGRTTHPPGWYAWTSGGWLGKEAPPPGQPARPVSREVPIDDFDVLRYNPNYLDPALSQLQKLVCTEAPVVLDSYFAARALTTAKNNKAGKDKVFETVWGGLYYEFRGIRRANAAEKAAGLTDEDVFFRQFGIDKAEALFDQLQSDQRAALWKSGVTGKKRRVDFFVTPAGHGWHIVAYASVTHDINERDIDVATNPLMNLLRFKDAAREDIVVGVNGMHIYAIFDGEGNLLDEADLNIVVDHSIPAPYAPKLQCALSCISCHEADGSDGWKNVPNDVKTMLTDEPDPLTGHFQLRPDIVADLTARDQVGAINRLAGLYLGDFKKGIQRGRNDYAETILKVSGPQGEDQTRIVKTAMSSLVDRTRQYLYGKGLEGINAKQALREVGVEPGENAVRTLKELLPPEPSALGFSPEDPRVIALKKGLSIPRADWGFVQSYVGARIYQQKEAQK